jgi:hypothetical protein
MAGRGYMFKDDKNSEFKPPISERDDLELIAIAHNQNLILGSMNITELRWGCVLVDKFGFK